MKHERHYTLEQANAALPWVGERIERLREAQELLTEKEARDALTEAAPGNGGGERLERALEAFKEAEDLSADDTVDPRVRDLVARRIESVRGLIEGGE